MSELASQKLCLLSLHRGAHRDGSADCEVMSNEWWAAKEEAYRAEKRRDQIIDEGGRKGVEIEGHADAYGLDFFCTAMQMPEG